MKRIKEIMMIISLLVVLTACQSQRTQDAPVSGGEAATDEKVTSESEALLRDELAEENEEAERVDSEGEVIHITEKMYVTYINDIFTNADEYMGKKIKLEGMFTSAYDEITGLTYYFVYRTGPGCCGNDGDMCGFEFTTTDPLPEEKDWIEVIGTLDSYEENGFTYLTLKDSKVTLKSERGQEVVYQ